MRNVVASSLLALSLLAVPAVASAVEAPAAQVAASAPPSPDPSADFYHRAQLTLGIDGNDSGLGGRAGLRYLWFEVQLGMDTAIFNTRTFVGVKLIPMPEATFSPYAYGRLGSFDDEELFGPHYEGAYESAGVGLDVNLARHVFLYGEGGVEDKDVTEMNGVSQDDVSTATSTEVHLGLGFRF